MALFCVAGFTQTVTLTFTGRDDNDNWVQLDRVVITNLTRGWQETIVWPDTTLIMQNSTGIDESVSNGRFGLSQNNPNPFTGTTDVKLTLAESPSFTSQLVAATTIPWRTECGTESPIMICCVETITNRR